MVLDLTVGGLADRRQRTAAVNAEAGKSLPDDSASGDGDANQLYAGNDRPRIYLLVGVVPVSVGVEVDPRIKKHRCTRRRIHLNRDRLRHARNERRNHYTVFVIVAVVVIAVGVARRLTIRLGVRHIARIAQPRTAANNRMPGTIMDRQRRVSRQIHSVRRITPVEFTRNRF